MIVKRETLPEAVERIADDIMAKANGKDVRQLVCEAIREGAFWEIDQWIER